MATQFIKNSKGENVFAVISLEKYNDLQYSNADLRQSDVPEWHKNILDEDIQLLEKDLETNSVANDLTWEELKNQIKAKYGY